MVSVGALTLALALALALACTPGRSRAFMKSQMLTNMSKHAAYTRNLRMAHACGASKSIKFQKNPTIYQRYRLKTQYRAISLAFTHELRQDPSEDH